MIRNVILIATVTLGIACNQQNTDFSKFEQANTPVILGKGSLSLDSVQWNNAYVSKTNEMYFTKMGKSASIIYKMDYQEGKFKNLEQLPFHTESPSSDVFVNSEGNLLLFSSLMQEQDNDTIMDWNIWKSKREEGKWQDPVPFFNKNLDGNQFYPWLTQSGNIYFAMTPHGSSNSDLFVSKFVDGNYQNPESLIAVNSDKLDGDAFVAPDESYLIFAGFDREEGLGKSDLFISFNENGKWSSPIWLGGDINSEGYDGSPFVTNDGQFLIFTSSRGSTDENTFFNHYIVKLDLEQFRV